MLVFLLTTLSALALQSTTAYSGTDVYRNDLTDKARDAVAQVISSISRPTKRQEPQTTELDDILTLLLRPNERLEEDLRELRFLINLLNTPDDMESVRTQEQAIRDVSQQGEVTSEQAGDSKPRLINLRSRSCSFRLGGHCATENLDKVMKQYHYLMSPDSPGRKRRSLHSILTNQKARNQ